MDVENKESCLQRDSAERKGYVERTAHSTGYGKERDSTEAGYLG